MLDFPFDKPSVYTALFATLSYLFICRYGFSRFRFANEFDAKYKFGSIIVIAFGLLMVVHSINGDFFHMLENVRYNMDFHDIYNRGQEAIYYIIAEFVDRNYFLFRLLIWLTAYILILKIFKYNDINPSLGIWTYLTCYSILFTYARASAAMAIYFLGLTYLCRENTNIIKKLIFSFGLILISFTFHRSMAILMLLTPLCFIPINKRTLKIVLCFMPLIIFMTRYFFSGLLNDLSVLDEEDLQRKISSYSEREASQSTIRNHIMNIFTYSSVYIPFLVSVYLFVAKGYYKNGNKTICMIFNYLFWLTTLTTAVSFLDIEVNTFFYRMLYMTVIPLTIITVYLYQNFILSAKIFKRILMFCVLAQMFKYMYMIYLNNL